MSNDTTRGALERTPPMSCGEPCVPPEEHRR